MSDKPNEVIGIVDNGSGPTLPGDVWLTSEGANWNVYTWEPRSTHIHVRRVRLVECGEGVEEAVVRGISLLHNTTMSGMPIADAIRRVVNSGVAIGRKQATVQAAVAENATTRPVAAGEEAIVGELRKGMEAALQRGCPVTTAKGQTIVGKSGEACSPIHALRRGDDDVNESGLTAPQRIFRKWQHAFDSASLEAVEEAFRAGQADVADRWALFIRGSHP